MSTQEGIRPAPVPLVLGGARGGPRVRTLRRDSWKRSPLITQGYLLLFVVYATWAAFQNSNYYVGASSHRDLISPFYSPCIGASCVPGSHGSFLLHWWTYSPALVILIIPLGFRVTCYYYRKAYYRSFWHSPQACGVADGHKKYTGETRFPLIIQNIHRYFFVLGVLLNIMLTIDAVMAFRMPGAGGIGVSVGTIVLCANAVLLWFYSVSCHACRHLCGGHVNEFSKHPVRHGLWKIITPLNAKHMQLAWVSLSFVALTDLYVRLVASGIITDPKIF
ncbi:MAG: hypothetical protein M0Z96_10450 [Actinomycetota bacterium]|nr:hypothetical protein [Actinomycetota bacterium]